MPGKFLSPDFLKLKACFVNGMFGQELLGLRDRPQKAITSLSVRPSGTSVVSQSESQSFTKFVHSFTSYNQKLKSQSAAKMFCK